jgi:hypothetical protein
MGSSFSCPSEFTLSPVGMLQCVAPCPADKGFQLSGDASGTVCRYTGDPSHTVLLHPLPAVNVPEGKSKIFSYKTLENGNLYDAELSRVQNALAIEYGKIDGKTKVGNAFKALQDAENVRSQAPDAYQTARVNYYTLTKGDGWVNEEKVRIAASEAQPVIDQYVSTTSGLDQQIKQQQSTIDVVNGVKDKVLSVQDDMAYSVGAFSKQIADVKNQINMQRHAKLQEEAEKSNGWIEILLNILIVLSTLAAIFFLIRKLSLPSAPVPRTPGTAEFMERFRRLMQGTGAK